MHSIGDQSFYLVADEKDGVPDADGDFFGARTRKHGEKPLGARKGELDAGTTKLLYIRWIPTQSVNFLVAKNNTLYRTSRTVKCSAISGV